MTATKNKPLYRVGVVDDFCCYGKCSLGIAIPTISAAGIEVFAIPTSIYSTHTAIKNYTSINTGDFINEVIDSWQKNNVNFDALYTGCLSSKNQVYSCLQMFTNHSNAIKIVDPVLGDFGRFYDKNFEKLLTHIKKLCKHADIITPNITEAQLLTGDKDNNISSLLKSLNKICSGTIILTGVIENNKISNYLYKNNDIKKFSHNFVNHTIHGAGDFFDSCLIASYLKTKNIEKSIEFATKIIDEAVKCTIKQPGFEKRGIFFENLLGKISLL